MNKANTEILKLFKYYHGEEKCPFEKDTPQSKFWFGEKMFANPPHSIEGWINVSQDVKNKLEDDIREKVEKQYTKEQFAIIIFIEELFSKWVGGDMSWIHQY
ncbi:MAG: hypothetical protein IKP73_10620 [Bacteroidales bacterium]|nr:hypothetical protein [Bacteroidales bacterium]